MSSGLTLNQRAIRSLTTQLQQFNYSNIERITSDLADYDSIQVMNTKLLSLVLIILEKYNNGIIINIEQDNAVLVPGFPNESDVNIVTDGFIIAKTNEIVRERLKADILRYAISISIHRSNKIALAREKYEAEKEEEEEEEFPPEEPTVR